MSVFRPFEAISPAQMLSQEELNELQFKFVLGDQMPLAINDDLQTLERQYEQLSLQRMQELQEKEQLADKLNATMQAMPLAVILVDAFGVVSDANPAADALLDEDSRFPLIGQSWSKVIRHCFAPQPDDGHEVSLKNGKKVSVVTSAIRTGGQLIVVSDLTETRALQAALGHHQRLTELGRMTASLAHQLRTPLSAALLYSHNLSRNLPQETQGMVLNKLTQQLKTLEQQLNDMLLFAKGDVQLSDLVTTAELLENLKQQSEAALQVSASTLFFHNDCSTALLRCNQELLLSVLMNLINNAIDAVGCNAQIECSVKPNAAGICLSIHDHGPGISQSIINKVTDPFYSTRTNGTGLGLAVAKSVVQAHGGCMSIESEPGHGCSVHLILPTIKGAQS